MSFDKKWFLGTNRILRNAPLILIAVSLACTASIADEPIDCPPITIEEAYKIISTYVPQAKIVDQTIQLNELEIMNASTSPYMCKKDLPDPNSYVVDAVISFGVNEEFGFYVWSLDRTESLAQKEMFLHRDPKLWLTDLQLFEMSDGRIVVVRKDTRK